MSGFHQHRAVFVGVMVWVALTTAALTQNTPSQIQQEIARLQQSLKNQSAADPEFAGVISAAGDSLKGASAELNAGRLYLSLEKLGLAEGYLEGAKAGADRDEVVKGGLPAYEMRWGKANLVLTRFDEEAARRDWSGTPAAIRALSETAQGRAVPLLEGGRGFATAAAPKDGLFYLGQAQGEAEFARFCASLKFSEAKRTLALRSMLPELGTLQQKTNAAFQPPRSIELHSRFIALNSALKLARELDSRRFYAGALYQYLEAVRHYGMLDAPAIDASKQGALKNAISAEQKKLAGSGRDVSIAQLFLERAASQLAHADGSAPTSDEWRSAKIIVQQVVPAYFAAEKAARATPSRSTKTVTLTLVRWPYT